MTTRELERLIKANADAYKLDKEALLKRVDALEARPIGTVDATFVKRVVDLEARPIVDLAPLTKRMTDMEVRVKGTEGIEVPAIPPAPPAVTSKVEGWGRSTKGGGSAPVVRMTTLEDSGPGSIRSTIAGGGRVVKSDVAGTADLDDDLEIKK